MTFDGKIQMLTNCVATKRLAKMIEGYEWTVEDTYAAQMMCPYDTVSLAKPKTRCWAIF